MVRNSHIYNLFSSSQLVSHFSSCPGGIFILKPCTIVQSGGALVMEESVSPSLLPPELTPWLDNSTFSSLFQTVLLFTEYTRLLIGMRGEVKCQEAVCKSSSNLPCPRGAGEKGTDLWEYWRFIKVGVLLIAFEDLFVQRDLSHI